MWWKRSRGAAGKRRWRSETRKGKNCLGLEKRLRAQQNTYLLTLLPWLWLFGTLNPTMRTAGTAPLAVRTAHPIRPMMCPNNQMSIKSIQLQQLAPRDWRFLGGPATWRPAGGASGQAAHLLRKCSK